MKKMLLMLMVLLIAFAIPAIANKTQNLPVIGANIFVGPDQSVGQATIRTSGNSIKTDDTLYTHNSMNPGSPEVLQLAFLIRSC